MSNNFRKTAVLKKNMNRKLLKIRATFRPHSAEVTANSNTLDVFQYKMYFSTKSTTIKMAGPTLLQSFPYASEFY